MASLFEKKILLSIGFMGFWFCCMTLYFVTRISSQEYNNSHSSSNSISSSRLRGGGGPLETSSKEILMMQHNPTRGYRPSSPKAQVPVVTFLTPQGGNKSIGGGVRPHSSLEDPDILDRTPFPQSIKNQKWERILHPAEIMRLERDVANDKHSFSRKNNAAADAAAADDDVYAADDQRTHLLVPPFWKPSHLETDVRSLLGNYGERLITPYEASLIGSHTPSFTNYDVQVGDAEEELIYDNNDDPQKKHRVSHISYVVDELPPEKVVMLETIYVSISSYRDYRCTHTVEMLFRQAKYPERIRVGIVDQLDPEEDESCIRTSHLKKDCEEDPEQIMCKYAHQMDVYEMDAQLAVGPVFARHIGHRMYRGEYFAMQTDAHMEFVNDWDVDVIEQWRSAKNEMAVLTTYVSSVEKHYNAKTGERDSNVRPYMCQTDFEEDYYNSELTFLMHGQQPEGEPSIVGEPLLIPFWAAGFSFARGHFVVQVPYDQYLPMVFQGEEISIGVRGFTHGYDFYAPEKSVLYHYYHTDPNKKKRKIKRFWEHADKYKGVEKVSKARLLGILQMFGSEVTIPTNTTQDKDEEKQQDAMDGGDASKKEQQIQGEKQQQVDEEHKGKEDKEEEEQKQQQEKEEEEKEENEGDYEIKEISWIAIDEKLYGTGKVRTVQKFLDTFGIDLKKMKVQKHLCRFVDAPMTKIFTKAMRSDKMGIDYDKIMYQFKDPEEYGKTWEQYM